MDSAYEQATQVLARLLGVDVAVLALETTVAEHSQTVLSFYAQREAFSPREEGPILVAQADGKGVRLVRDEAPPTGRRGKGDKKTRKKEAIAVTVYTIAPDPRTPQEVVTALFEEGSPAGVRPVP